MGSSSQQRRLSPSKHSNLFNAALAVVVAIPCSLFYALFLLACPAGLQHLPQHWQIRWQHVCSWGYAHPIALLNIIFFLNVNILFWIISLVQGSTWLIDPYWTILPVMMAHYYAAHPSAKSDSFRSRVVLTLVWIWSIRLTHSYFRREDWNWGKREDWRFAEMRQKYGKSWWWISFFTVYLSQQIFLVGICLPLYTIYNSTKPWNFFDSLFTVLCILGIAIAYNADTRLHKFVRQNRRLKELGAATVPVLDQGIWHYSRHPNYVGEQMWWWGLALFSWNVGQNWAIMGAFVNSMCLAYVTILVERRMLADTSRAEAYGKYQKSTPVWVPCFNSNYRAKKD